MMDEVINGIDWNFGRDYIDDILCESLNFESHFQVLQKLFNRLRECSLKIKLSKCKFFKKTLIFLGHEISDYGVKTRSFKS
jgi:hypothetical protein